MQRVLLLPDTSGTHAYDLYTLGYSLDHPFSHFNGLIKT